MTHVDTCRHMTKADTSQGNITGLEDLALQERHCTAQMTSMMTQSDGNDKTDGTSGVGGQTHTDEMAHRLLEVTYDLEQEQHP